jgi:tetratricopeptide (TPR) repeat protein
MERFAKAAAIRPGDAAAQYQIGALELQVGRTAEAQAILERVVAAAPDFTEAHVSLATAYYRLKRKEDGDRHRALARELTAKQQAKEPGVQSGGDAYRGEPVPIPSDVKKDPPKPPQPEEGPAARPRGSEGRE